MTLRLAKTTKTNLAGQNKSAIKRLIPPSRAFPTRKLEQGSVLYEAGREAKLLYLLKKGLLKAIVPTVMGKNRLVDFYHAGDIVGFAALNGGRHAETVIALDRASLIPLDPDFVSADENLSSYILHNLAKQLEWSREVVAASELPVGARVAWFLKSLSERFGKQTANHKVLLPLELTHEDIASLVHSSRVTVTKVLGELRNDEAVYGSRGAYITDMERLEAAADHYVLDGL